MIGTTHFTNAFVQARDLAPCGVIRLGLPATTSTPPFVEWPAGLVRAVGANSAICHGGLEFDGRPISAIDPAEIRRTAAQMGERGVQSIAISSIFSPLSADCENEAAALVAEVLPDAHVSLSHEIGRIGLLERENATVINASLRVLAEIITGAFVDAVADVGVRAPVFISQNDGTLMSVDQARRYPVLTFASGPTNSMRGAAFLSGLDNCVVVDVGGTTTDVGMVLGGFPRPAGGIVELVGVRTNFRMPDLCSVGIGGGSLVDIGGAGVGIAVGPTSVGHRLLERATVCGGDVLTATDVAVAGGLLELGDRSLVAHLDPHTVDAVLGHIDQRVAETVDGMRSSADPIPWVLVGGGSVLVRTAASRDDPLVRPDHFAVANAVGAAIAQVGGEIDRVVRFPPGQRDAVLDDLKTEAVGRALAAGAQLGTIDIVEVEHVPLSYLADGSVRVRVKAVGDLDLSARQGELADA
jgi:N-methylhydantoinase A/oxoprolinase/acetone carboxylase beta subunit